MRLPRWITHHIAALRALIVFTIITGIAYPLVIFGIAQLPGLHDKANGSIVTVNGKALGQAWHAPYRVDATSALKPGVNEITIKVVNAWVNRLIGDEQTGATKITFADVKPYKANSPLLPSIFWP